MKKYNYTIGVLSVIIVGLVIYSIRKNKKTERILEKVADEGYETAEDILFPLRSQRLKGSR